MYRVNLEIACPRHGFERYSIKVLKRFNMPSKNITPRFSKLRPQEMSRLYVGRDVTQKEIKRFFNDYFLRTGMKEAVLKMKIQQTI
ncbi:MAG: hypothetical protein PVF96_04425 [Candidatus Bathyarchaeota archaeon]